jgi:hypothetical protein
MRYTLPALKQLVRQLFSGMPSMAGLPEHGENLD